MGNFHGFFEHPELDERGEHVIFGRDEGIASFGDRHLCELAQLSHELEGWLFCELGIEAKRPKDRWSRLEHALRFALPRPCRGLESSPKFGSKLTADSCSRVVAGGCAQCYRTFVSRMRRVLGLHKDGGRLLVYICDHVSIFTIDILHKL